MTGINFLPKLVKQLLTPEQSDVLKTTSNQDVSNTLFDEETTLVTSDNTIVDLRDNDDPEEISITDDSHDSDHTTTPVLPDFTLIHKITSGLHQNSQAIQVRKHKIWTMKYE